MKWIQLIAICLVLSSCGSAKPKAKSLGDVIGKDLLKDRGQLVLVTVDDWNSTIGTMHTYFINDDHTWSAVHTDIPVNLGKNGLAWGSGLPMAYQPAEDAVYKKEGDGKSPAGAFDLSFVFGYEDLEDLVNEKDRFTEMPYLGVDEMVECVDDVESKYYNTIQVAHDSIVDWNSSEEMRRQDSLYWMGVFVEHNTPAEAGKGSCIFLHVQRGPESPTAGCTSMERKYMTRLAHWLVPDKRPLLVQIPKSLYQP